MRAPKRRPGIRIAAYALAAFASVIVLSLRLAADEAKPLSATDGARILSIGGDVTEILYDLGEAEKIVAVDTTSRYPESALKEKKSVGYLRALSAEGVLAVNPTMILASNQAGPPEVVRVLKSSSIRYVEVEDRPSAEGVPAKVRFIGEVIGAHDAAKRLAAKVEGEFMSLDIDRKLVKQRKRALFILTIQNGRATVGGSDTSADAILRLAGAENAASDISGYKPVSDEQLTKFAPEAVVVMTRSDGDRRVAEQALKLPGLSSSPAAKDQSWSKWMRSISWDLVLVHQMLRAT